MLHSSYNHQLFKKSSYGAEWDETSPEWTSMSSASPAASVVVDEGQSSDGSKPSPLFTPTVLGIGQKLTICEGVSPNDSVYTTDSLEGTLQTETSEQEVEEEASIKDSEDIPDIEDRCERKKGNPIDYLEKEVFPVLLPCFEKMLFAAKENDVLKVQKSRFNGLDYLAELLWNSNPLHPERKGSYVPLFDIPFVQKHLEEHPRPIIPQSWLWTRDQAAIVIQAAVRGWLVRRQEPVQELRQFWKTLAKEKLPKEPGALERQMTNESQSDNLAELEAATTSIFSFCSQYRNKKSEVSKFNI